MKPHAYAIFLSQPIFPELVILLGDYVHTTKDLKYIVCNSFEHLGSFVVVEMVYNKSDTNPWAIQIPVGCVFAIADMSKGVGLGFLAHIQ